MNLVVTDELRRMDEAFSRNRLLSTFAAEARALLEPFGTIVELERNEVVHDSGADVTSSYFPFGSTMVSLVVDLDGGRSIEVASIGQEGAVGGIVSCGHTPAFARAQEALAGLLGVQRTTVNAVARQLQDEGLIASRRGAIQVVDRAGLKRRSCECYAAVESHFAGVIGSSGTGGNANCG